MLSKFACGLWVQTISKHHDYLYVRLYWTEFGSEANVIEEYILFTALLHEVVAQKRTWDTSINYIFASGKSNFDSELHACGFNVKRFAKIYAAKMGVNKEKLMKQFLGATLSSTRKKTWH